jgi:hypothetical protein
MRSGFIFARITPTTTAAPARPPRWIDRFMRRASPDDGEAIRPMTPEEIRAETDWLNRPRASQWRRLP